MSIKITKPKLTINGFQIDQEDLAKKQSVKSLKKSTNSADMQKRRMSTSTINSRKNIKTKESLNEDVSNIIEHDEEEIPNQEDDQEQYGEQYEYQQEQMDDNQENYDLYNNACSGAQQYQEEDVERNPQKYAYYPSCWTKKIQPAGKFTYRSEDVGNILA